MLRLTPDLVMDRDQAIRWADLLEPWIELDRQNIINSRAAMYWVEGPRRWRTNEPLAMNTDNTLSAFFWNGQNLDDCLRNFTRSAVALRMLIDKCEAEGKPCPPEFAETVDGVLHAHRDDLDPHARRVLDGRGPGGVQVRQRSDTGNDPVPAG